VPNRVCRRETYHVKLIIRCSLIRYTQELENSTSEMPASSRYQVAADAHSLLMLFDDIIVEEYDPSHASMIHLNDTDGPITCDFCSCDVFQSFFECSACARLADPKTADQVAPGHGLVICPMCYVSGRTCKCGNMAPRQVRSFSDLFADRDRAVKALKRCWSKDKACPELDDNHITRYAYSFSTLNRSSA
jgi:hypothetical protein